MRTRPQSEWVVFKVDHHRLVFAFHGAVVLVSGFASVSL